MNKAEALHPGFGTRLVAYFRLVRLHKPVGIGLLLWPVLWALWIAAEGLPSMPVLLIFVLGVVLMRSAGCAINDFADRELDGQVARTQDRPLAQGIITPKEAIAVFVVLALVAFALVLMTNQKTILLSFVGAGLAFCYPFAKRYTHWPQLVLGAAFAWGIPMAFMAQVEQLPAVVWQLFTITLLWTIAYDTQYAMVDREDDLKVGIKSTAIRFGQQDRLIIAGLQALVLLGWLYIAASRQFGWGFYGLLACAAMTFVYQTWLIRQREPKGCFKAFLNNNLFGLLVFLGLLIEYNF